MKPHRKKTAALAFFLIFFLITPIFPCSLSQQPQVNTSPEIQQEKPPEKIHPAPQNIKEKIGLLVFLGWLWLSIFVLIYFLRLKIQEADRLYELEFYSPPKK